MVCIHGTLNNGISGHSGCGEIPLVKVKCLTPLRRPMEWKVGNTPDWTAKAWKKKVIPDTLIYCCVTECASIWQHNHEWNHLVQTQDRLLLSKQISLRHLSREKEDNSIFRRIYFNDERTTVIHLQSVDMRPHSLSSPSPSFYKSLLIPFCTGTHHESMKHMTWITWLLQQRLNLCVLHYFSRNKHFLWTSTLHSPLWIQTIFTALQLL